MRLPVRRTFVLALRKCVEASSVYTVPGMNRRWLQPTLVCSQSDRLKPPLLENVLNV